LDSDNQHPLEHLPSHRPQGLLQLGDRNHVLDEHQGVHPHLEIALRAHQELKDLQYILQETTNLRTAVPNNRVELEPVLTRAIPASVLLCLNRSHEDWPDLSSVQLRNTREP
jgi:hypothetical protein